MGLPISDNDANNRASSTGLFCGGLVAITMAAVSSALTLRWIDWELLLILPLLLPSSELLSSRGALPVVVDDTAIIVRLRLPNCDLELGNAGGGPNPTSSSLPTSAVLSPGDTCGDARLSSSFGGDASKAEGDDKLSSCCSTDASAI